MSDATTCPTCGAGLASDAARGLCPACLFEAGFATGGAPVGDQRVPTIEELAPKFPGLAIEALVGRGGMGVVYRARHKALDREVALKVLSESAAAGGSRRDAAFADRFQREARALAKLQHPNIVAVHDFGVTDGLFWLVMEYVDGVNVREAMRAGHIGPKEALAIVPQICDALQYAHEHGVVHRDIKPENVLLDKAGRVKVADFGLAKLMGGEVADRTLTGAGQVMGTPHYMAPEQVEHPTEVDHRADIYSLGVVFYEMLTGELPLGRFAAPSGKCDVNARIDEIVMRTLEKEREARYQHVSQVKTDMGRASAGAPRRDVPRKRWRELLPPSPSDQAKEDRTRESVVGALLAAAGLNGWLVSHLQLSRGVEPVLGLLLLALAAFARFHGADDPDSARRAWRRRRLLAYGALAVLALAGVIWSVAESVHTKSPGGLYGCLLAVVLLAGLARRWNIARLVVVLLLVGTVSAIVMWLSNTNARPLLSVQAAARLSLEDFEAQNDQGDAIDLPREDRAQIDRLWREARLLPSDPSLDQVDDLYTPQARAELRAMTAQERERKSASGECGVLLLPRRLLSRPLSEFRLVTVQFFDPPRETGAIGTTKAVATLRAGDQQIRFFFERPFYVDSSTLGPWHFDTWAVIDK